MKFGQIIREARKAKGIKTQDFAKQIGISANYLSQIEGGYRFPNREKLDKMCNLLEISNPPLHEYDRHTVSLILSERMASDYQLFNALGIICSKEISGAKLMEVLC